MRDRTFDPRCIWLAVFVAAFAASSKPKISAIEIQDARVSIAFDTDMDTSVNPFTTIELYPGLFGYWEWHDPQRLDFVSNATVSDTTVYILNVHPGLRDAQGNALGPRGFIVTEPKIISYSIERVPLQWDDVSDPDVEIDWQTGLRIYTIKDRLHSSYPPAYGVACCWRHPFYGPLRENRPSPNYPHFVTSASRRYGASVDSTGALYLIDRYIRVQHRSYVLPTKQRVRSLDISDKGEVLVAMSASEDDTVMTAYLLDPAGRVAWVEHFAAHEGRDTRLDVSFVNAVDKFAIQVNAIMYCYSIQRAE